MKRRVVLLALIAALCLSTYTSAFSQGSYVNTQGFPVTPAFAPEIASFPSTKYTGTMNVTAYTSPDSSYDLTLEYLRSAEFEIDIEIYSISNGFLVGELNDALARNNSMEMNVIISEGHASGAETHWSRATMYNLSQAKASIPAPNLNIFESNGTEFTFTHAKFIIIDREVVLVQSCNWAKTGVPPDPSRGHREWGVAIKDQDVVDYFLDVFTNDMLIATPYTPNPAHQDDFGPSVDTGPYPHPFSSQTFVESMSIQPVLSPDNSNATIGQLLRSANSTLYVQQMYIKRYWDSGDDYFLEELIAAAGRGVTVRAIIDGESSGMTEVANYLISNGVAVAFDSDTYFDEPLWTHNKGVIVDGKIVLVSSINWSHESVNENRETGVMIYSQNIANYFTQVFQWDWNIAEYLGGGNGGDGNGLEIPIEYLAIGGVVGVIIIAVIALFAKKK